MPGIVLAIGPDAYTDPLRRFNSLMQSVGTVTIGAGGRNSRNAVITTVASIAAPTVRAMVTLPSAISELWFHFAYICNALPPALFPRTIAIIRDAGTPQCELRLHSDGTLSVARNGTQIFAVPSFAMMVNTHNAIEWRVKIHATLGEVAVWVNKVQRGTTQTNLNTKNSANSTVSEIGLTHAASGADSAITKFRDIVVRDDAPSGDVRVREDLPTGTGSVDDGVPDGSSPAASTRESVDELNPNDGLDFAKFVNVGDKSLWTYPAIPTSEDIVAVIPMYSAQKSAPGTGAYKAAMKIGGSDYLGAEMSPSTGSFAYLPDPMMVSPDTGIAWTAAELNAMELGAEKSA